MAGGDRGRDSDGDAEGGDSDVEGALGRLNTKGSPAAAEAGSNKGNGKDAAQVPAAGRRPAAGRQRNERVRMAGCLEVGAEKLPTKPAWHLVALWSEARRYAAHVSMGSHRALTSAFVYPHMHLIVSRTSLMWGHFRGGGVSRVKTGSMRTTGRTTTWRWARTRTPTCPPPAGNGYHPCAPCPKPGTLTAHMPVDDHHSHFHACRNTVPDGRNLHAAHWPT